MIGQIYEGKSKTKTKFKDKLKLNLLLFGGRNGATEIFCADANCPILVM